MIVIDTNVISESMRIKPMPLVMDWIEKNDEIIHIPTVALAELMFGIHKVPIDQRSPRWLKRLNGWRERYSARTLVFDVESADIYGDLMGHAYLLGRPIGPLDGMIAAIALRHGAAVATRNIGHFQIAGLKVIDPWRGLT